MFEGIFVPQELAERLSDEACVARMREVEFALGRAEARAGVLAKPKEIDIELDVDELVAQGRSPGNPVEPLVRALRGEVESVHFGATSQDILDTALVLIARSALEVFELDELAAACARLAATHRDTVMAARTLLQQAVPTTFGLVAANWLVALLQARSLVTSCHLEAELGGAGGTLAALGDRGPEVLRLFAEELSLPEPVVPWHTNRVRFAQLGSVLAIAAGVAAKIGLDVQLLSQTEVAEVREAVGGASSTMPHKRNPVGSTRARACARHAQAAASVLLGSLEQEHERAAGAWHAEWKALRDALAYAGGAVAAAREVLDGLEVDPQRMRANIADDTLSEARRLGLDAQSPEDYLGSATAFVDRALELYRAS